MKRSWRTALMAGILALAMATAGCASAQPQEPQSNVVGGKTVLTDENAMSSGTDGMPETPPIEADPYLSAGEGGIELQSTSVKDIASSQITYNDLDRLGNGEAKSRRLEGEVRAVWISFLDLSPILTGKTEAQFTAGIKTMFDNCKDYGVNTLFVHVRPYGDALYKSSFFPWSYLATGTEGVDPGYDPLAIMVREARARELQIEAWVNPYRVRAKGGDKPLASSNQAKKWLDNNDDSVIQYDGVISYNPASEKAQELILNGVRELIRNYDIDGIHIDDYFYPHTDEAFDKASYTAYKNGGGSLGLADWRRSNVEQLIQKMYKAVKTEDTTVRFGISPQSSVANNYGAQYLDVEKIVSTEGYCDYICPQIYFGFDNGTQPFAETLDTWSNMVKTGKIDLYVGIAAYKCGVEDTWAGKGSKEWTTNKDLLKQMVEYSREAGHYKGFAIYRYDSLFNPASGVSSHVKAESDHLKSLLQ